MPHFSERFLDELRAALPVLGAVQRRHKMRKTSAHEWQAIDDTSLTVNDQKNIWNDFGEGKHGGDVFEYLQFEGGCSTFQQAVEEAARQAGIALPREHGGARPNGHAANGHAREPIEDGPPPGHPAGGPSLAAKREVVAVYDFHDADGDLLYQTVRHEWVDGGRKRKSIIPRRPVRGEDGWVWGLKAGDYIRARVGDWWAATEDRREKWTGAEVRAFPEVPATLMRLPELLDEAAQPADEQRAVFVPEGEKDRDTLEAWGLLATTHTGGGNGWQARFGEHFAGLDVVVLTDNDAPGRALGQTKASTIRPFARRVRVLDWRDHWPGVPEKADVTDWRDRAGGTSEQLLAIADRLPDWVPVAPESNFDALRFVDLGKPRRRLEWLIKGVMQRGEMSVWFGDWGTGKSFLLTDAGFAIARGIQWFGLRTRPGVVCYQAGEGGIGFGNRMEAYKRVHRLPDEDDVPFVALRKRVNLFVGNEDVERLIAECLAWRQFYDMPLELVVIDTFSAATTGADENSGRDIGPVLERGRRVCMETGAHVALVHHIPKGGSTPRGWSGMLGNVDSAVLVENLDQVHEEEAAEGRLVLPIHQFTVHKQKDAPAKTSRQFILPQIKLGVDGDGDPETSCVLREVGNRVAAVKGAQRVVPPGWYTLNEANEALFRSLIRAIKENGRPVPAGVPAPPGTRAVTVGEWQAQEAERQLGHVEITDTLRNTIRKRIQRACERWGTDKARILEKQREWIWRTDKRVFGIDEVPRAPEQPKPLLAPGERADDIGDLLDGA